MRYSTAMQLSHDLRRLAGAVSRSFALSLRALPGAVRDPIALAYMIARASDTVADADGPFSDQQRLDLLDHLQAGIAALPAGGTSLREALSDFSARMKGSAERTLLLRLPELLDLASALTEPTRAELQGVLSCILSGQRSDVGAFPRGTTSFHSLPDEAALDRYTYLVAGCVGGFWTRLCLAAFPGCARASGRFLVDEGVRFGRGLQLVNILRDRPEDLAKGRCYIPVQTSAPPEPGLLEERSRPWFVKARKFLDAGDRYLAATRGFRLRLAVAMPLLIGKRTLDLVEEAGPRALRERIKVRRPEMRRILIQAAVRAALG